MILQAGRNCWVADAPIDSAGLLVDGRTYFRNFYAAARQARHYILIAGWKFNSGVQLLRGEDAQNAGQAPELVSFLRELCVANSDLHIYLLAWNYSLIYVHEWEWFLESKFSSKDGRMQFRFDDQHASTASHHQKFVVIDGTLAYVGGLDLNGDDWDDRNHPPHSPHRINAKGEHYEPYHDLQSVMIGPIAEELARYFHRRWIAAGGDALRLPTAASAPAIDLGLPIHARRGALSVNEPATSTDDTSVVQIRNLYADMFEAANEFIYIENQYLTSDRIGDALMARMRDHTRPRLNIAVILPKQLTSTIEAAAMEPPRLKRIQALSETARVTGHHFGTYYSAQMTDDAEVATLIHSKLMIVDDRILTVGSANMSNRSMGHDTELNVTWEASASDQALIDSIRRIRLDLLAEHCGLPAVKDRRDLVAYLDEIARQPSSRLRLLNRDVILRDRGWLAELERWGIQYDPTA